MSYRPFVIISYLRSGTHLLRTTLESHPGVVCQSEVFNSDNPNLPYPLSTSTEKVLADWVFKDFPTGPAGTIQQVGFVLQAYHPFTLKAFPGIRDNPAWGNIWSILADMPDLSVIHLHRGNLLRRHLSHVLARATGQWHDWDKQRVQSVTHLETDAIQRATTNVRRERMVTLDQQQLQADFIEVESWHKRAKQQLANQRSLSISYEQLCDDFVAVSNTVVSFLGLAEYPLQAAVKKLESRPLRAAIANYEQLKAHFSDTKWSGFFVG